MLLSVKYISIYSIHFILYYLDKKTIYEHFFLFLFKFYKKKLHCKFISMLNKKKELMIKFYFNYKIIIKIKIMYNVIHKILTLQVIEK